MDILLDNIIFSLQKSGGISVVWQQHLNRLINDSDFNCQFLEYDNSESNFFRKQLSLNEELIDKRNSYFLFLKRYMNLMAKNNEKHLFHSSYYRLEKGTNTINITTVHDFTYEYFFKGFTKKVHSLQKKTAINGSEGIICISQSTKRDLLKFLPHIDETKIRVIYNGVDEVFKKISDSVAFEKKHSFDNYSYAIFIGDRKASYKNFDIAVDACSLLKINLLIIGGGNLTDKERTIVKHKLGEEQYLHLLNVSGDDLNYYYNNAHCLLYPSLYEGFGIPVLEAQQAGCPVIATNTSSIPEVIGNDYFALNNPSSQKISEKIKELFTNSGLRTETIELGIEKSKKFTWQNTYQETKEFYHELYKI
ncbi:glycosyltransferase family 4 protein [Flavobacterium sp. RS13.1]|uniref:glycosyltransferase family 4 protein n=1 Tax=Flavobacterium sp. RS13.1 TaxID=3400345 RepID=UPI003AAB1353